TIEPFMIKPYEILIDLTKSGQSNEIQSQWIQQFILILPFHTVDNLTTLYFYNANTAFRNFSKKFPYILFL
ncbi:7230_t:CDS:1, partial [Entrophospora sp. SA101]